MINNKENKTKFEKRNIRLRTFAGVVGLSFFSLTTTLLFLNKPQKTEAAWWESSWRYRQRIAIQYSGVTSLENYQVLLNDVNTSALVTAGKLQSDCDDLRFAGADGVQYDYWIESGCNTTTTDIWVEVNRINAPGKEIYMYYGNPTAPIGSNGKETFLMFEDFVGESIASLETQGWTKNYTTNLGMVSPPAYSIVDNQLFIDNNYGYGMWAYFVKESNLTEAVFRSRVKQTGYYLTTATRTGMSFRTIPNVTTNAAPTQQWYFAFEGASVDYLHSGNGVSANGTVTSSQNVWYVLETVASSTSSMAYRDSTYFSTVTASSQTGGMGAMQYEAESYYDYFLARTYAAIEPTTNAPSAEEISKEPVLHLSFDEGQGTTVYNDSGTQPPRDPLAYWKMDEGTGLLTYDTMIGGNRGSLESGATWVEAKHGKGVSFDGTDDYIEIKDNNIRSAFSKNLTFSFWAYFRDDTRGILLGTYNEGSDQFNFEKAANRSLRIWWGGGSLDLYTGNNVFNLNEWQQISIVRLDSGFKIYVNGAEIYNYTGTVSNLSPDGTIRLGRDTRTGTTTLYGYLDEVKLYDYALNPAQIEAEYTHTNGMMINMDETTDWVQGVNGTALDFDGVNDYVDMGDVSAYAATSQGITYSAWIYPTAYPAAHGMIMSKNLPYFSLRNTGALTFSVSVAGTQRSLTTAASIIPLNSWSYVVGNIDSSGYLRIYLNGNLISTSPQYPGAIANVAQILAVGRHGSSSSYYFTGQIDEAKVYTYARTTDEVKADFNAYKNKVGTSVGMGGRTPSQSSTEKPILWYDFNQGTGTSVYDQSGNGNHGLMTNMDDKTDYVSGMYGKALDFDGTDDYVATSNEAALEGMAGITVSAWVKRNTDSGVAEMIVSKFWDGTNRSWRLAIEAGDVASFLAPTDTQNDNDRAYSSTALAVGQWYYVTGTWSSATGLISIYINGILQNTTAQTGSTIRANNAPVWVGRDYYNNVPGYPLSGQVDDVKIYNYARTVSQIHEDMNGSPISYWKLDEGYGTTAYDTMGNKNGTLTNMDAGTDWVNGKRGKALEFNTGDANDVVPSTSAYNNGDEVTWMLWAKPVSYTGVGTATNWQMLLSQYHWDSENNWGITYDFNYNGNNRVRFKRTSGYTTVTYPSSNISLGEWNHLAVTYSKSSQEVKLYHNGKNVATGSNAGESILYSSNSSYNRIGIANRLDHNGYCPFTGSVDEVKIYNYALTEDQIKSDYNGSGGSPSFDGTSVSYGVEDTAAIGFTMPEPIAYWNFDEGSGTSLQDVSNGGNTGTLTNGPTWTQGKYGKGLSFDGTNDYVNLTGVSSTAQTYTFSMWIKTSLTNTTNRYLLDFGTGRFLLALFSDVSGQMGYYDGSWKYLGQAPNDGEWHHLAFVLNASTLLGTLHVDGIQLGTAQVYSPKNLGGAVGLATRFEYTGNWYQGQIDEVKIYTTALTPAQIAWEYNKGKPIFHMKMDQKEFYDCDGAGAGTATVCESMQGLHGTANGGMTDSNWVSGKFGNALNFDGVDDYVRRSSWNYDLKDRFTISAWVKATSFAGGNKYIVELMYGKPVIAVGYNDISVSLRNSGDTTWLAYASNVDCLTDGAWNHIAATYQDDDALFLYCNGKQVYSGSHPNHIGGSAPTTLDIGGRNTVWFAGQIDDVRVYNYSRTAEQVKQDYLNGAAILFQ